MHQPSTGPDWLDRRIRAGEVILIDGAMGTELEARGVPMDDTVWCGAAVLDHGGVAQAIHEDYIRAGADVIITNTFATARHSLEPAGHGAAVASVNRKAVELARRARDSAADRPIAIAGSISAFIAATAGSEWREPASLAATFREQAELLAEAGVDLIVLEMMQHLDRARPAVEAAVATGLPVWIGCSCRRAPAGPGLVSHDQPLDDFGELLAGLAGLGGALMAIMHSDVDATLPGLELLRAHWSGPTGAYPNSGHFVMPNWQFVDIISPDALAAEAIGWIEQGAQVIGGCCGIGPDHIRRLKQLLPAKRPTATGAQG